MKSFTLALLLVSVLAHADGFERVTFSQAVSTAITHNPIIDIARSNVIEADALRIEQRSFALPTLYGNAIYTHLDNNRVLNGNVISGQDQLFLNFTLTAPIIAARAWGAWRRAADIVDVNRAGLKSTERDAALGAARAYLAVVSARRLLEVAVVGRDTAKSHLEYADKRYSGGIGTRLDVVRSAQEVESTETQLASADVQLIRSREALGVAIGLDKAVDAVDDPTFPAAEDGNEDRRADVVAAKRAVWAAERGSKDLWRDFMPTIAAVFEPFYQNPPTLTVPLLGWQGLVSLSLPIYDGGLRYGQQKERDATTVAAKARLEAANRQARAEVRVGHAAVHGADIAFAKAKQAQTLAHEAAELAKLGYQNGAATNLELIDADRRARDADATQALAEDALRQAQLEALAATGQFP